MIAHEFFISPRIKVHDKVGSAEPERLCHTFQVNISIYEVYFLRLIGSLDNSARRQHYIVRSRKEYHTRLIDL